MQHGLRRHAMSLSSMTEGLCCTGDLPRNGRARQRTSPGQQSIVEIHQLPHTLESRSSCCDESLKERNLNRDATASVWKLQYFTIVSEQPPRIRVLSILASSASKTNLPKWLLLHQLLHLHHQPAPPTSTTSQSRMQRVRFLSAAMPPTSCPNAAGLLQSSGTMKIAVSTA